MQRRPNVNELRPQDTSRGLNFAHRAGALELASVVLGLLLLAVPASAQEPPPPPDPEPPVIAAELVPGFTVLEAPAPAAAATPAAEPVPFAPLSAIVPEPGGVLHLETATVLGSGAPLAAATLHGRLSISERTQLGVAVPWILDLDTARAALGNIALEAGWRLSRRRSTKALAWNAGLRVLVTTGTSSRRFVLVPQHQGAGGGVEAGVALSRRTEAWAFHLEVGGGAYFDSRTVVAPLRLGFTGLGSYHLVGPLHAVAQIDPWLLWVLDRDDGNTFSRPLTVLPQLGVAGGLGLEWDGLRATALYQKVVNHSPDHHVWLSVEWRMAPAP